MADVPKVILVDQQKLWWVCELVDGYLGGNLKIVEKFPDELKDAWKPEFHEFIESIAPQIVYFDENGQTCSTPLTSDVTVSN